jgi:F0F1-type ATP synthase assembly protein I
MPKDVDPEKLSRRQQIVATYRMGKQSDPRLGLWLVGAFVVGAAVGFGLFWFLPGTGPLRLVIAIVGSLLLGLLAAAVVFGRRVQRSAYRQLEGRPGAAGQALGTLRRGWKTEPMIAFNKQQDVVHRVVGPPGIVLVGEGNPNRLRGLLTNERRKHERVAADIPIHEVMCGNDEGQVPLPRLVKHVTKLGRNVKPAELTDVLNRLKALDASRSNIPMPKGPVPTSMKGLRGQMRGKR